ncbi:hypothetical protein AVEN_40239-1 [Araneus ventricosus]|uniref:Uncharacterized protein n=1 Tax=Araneus ventricosus TaxID=182803 RepID=A0A4Y2JBW4_ARAVE|nr:hypothetical protein AVEN_40239-1 [Araneus ventricosus]
MHLERSTCVPVVITLSSKSCNCYRSSPLSSRTKTIALTGFVVGIVKSTVRSVTATLRSLASYLEIFNPSPDSSDTLCRDSHVPVVITLLQNHTVVTGPHPCLRGRGLAHWQGSWWVP